MKLSKCFPLLALVMLFAGEAQGQSHFGVGVIFGDPTGLTGKVQRSVEQAIDFGLAYSIGESLALYGDYLWHFPGGLKRLAPEASRTVTPYLGVGATLTTGKARRSTGDAWLGARIPLGLEWRPASPLLGVFLELVPGIGIVPSVFGFFQGGVGVRYFF